MIVLKYFSTFCVVLSMFVPVFYLLIRAVIQSKEFISLLKSLNFSKLNMVFLIAKKLQKIKKIYFRKILKQFSMKNYEQNV